MSGECFFQSKFFKVRYITLTGLKLKHNSLEYLKDTHRDNALTNKTQTLVKSVNMNIWVIDTLNQLFIRDSYIEIKFSKK